MTGEKSISALLKGMSPALNEGDYVFCTTQSLCALNHEDIVGSFHEHEGLTIILRRERAEALGLNYDYVASWITLTIHSSLEAVGLTAAFATALSNAGISCNVVAAYYHDHIFVGKQDSSKALEVLKALAKP